MCPVANAIRAPDAAAIRQAVSRPFMPGIQNTPVIPAIHLLSRKTLRATDRSSTTAVPAICRSPTAPPRNNTAFTTRDVSEPLFFRIYFQAMQEYVENRSGRATHPPRRLWALPAKKERFFYFCRPLPDLQEKNGKSPYAGLLRALHEPLFLWYNGERSLVPGTTEYAVRTLPSAFRGYYFTDFQGESACRKNLHYMR